MRYHWFHRLDASTPVLTYPDELTGETELRVACTQTGLSPSKQRALVRTWCEVLPTLSHVKALRLTSRVPQVLFDAACQMPQLADLWVKWSGVTTIAAIKSVASLQYFHLGSSARLESIEPLAQMHQLKWLGLENLNRVDTVEVLGNLTELDGLSLEGSMWNTWRIRSLAPLGSLRNLKYLSLAALRSEDRSLAPLFSLSGLETLILPTWWDDAEIQEIRRRNRSLAV
jgi:hypothetical protein